MSAEVARILRKAADLVEPPGRWITGSWARDAEGQIVPPGTGSAVCWCIEGAIFHVAAKGSPHSEQLFEDAAEALERYLGLNPIAWNEAQYDSRPVVAALRAAADEAEAS